MADDGDTHYVLDARAEALLADVVRRVKTLRGGPGIRVSNSTGGIVISLERSTPYNPDNGGGGGGVDSAGTLQGQVHQMLTDSADGWDYERFSP